jgi:DNA replication and repair protein RecF
LSTLLKITLTQFRNYTSADFSFEKQITCISGLNGAGKTNLLDAVYYLCYTKSYFTGQQQNNVTTGYDGFRIEGVFENAGNRESVVCKWKQGKKEVLANTVPYEKITDHIGKYGAVMIAPDDIELINEGSELRRKWLDGILGQTDPEYLERLMQYQHVLLQRNAWLKNQALSPTGDFTALDFYDTRLSVNGAYLYARREQFITGFLPLLGRYYAALSGGKEDIQLVYESDLKQMPMPHWLADFRQHDMRMQRTLKGIHKDDLEFRLQGRALRQFGSQGQKKTFLFALKLAQYEYLRATLGHPPILLLDDIFEKLDQNRIEALLRIIRAQHFGQVLLTDTHPDRVMAAFGKDAEMEFICL